MDSARFCIFSPGHRAVDFDDQTRALRALQMRGAHSVLVVLAQSGTFTAAMSDQRTVVDQMVSLTNCTPEQATGNLRTLIVCDTAGPAIYRLTISWHSTVFASRLSPYVNPLAPAGDAGATNRAGEIFLDALQMVSRVPGLQHPPSAVDALRRHLAAHFAATADRWVDTLWEPVSRVLGGCTTGVTDSHLLAASLERIRLAQNFFRELMGAYRSVGEQEARDLCREQLDELNSILQVLTLEAALLDTQQARIASTREEERAQKLTTLALILVFPAIYLAALPYIIPTDSADLDFRVWLTVGGAAASSLFGWLASHQLVGLSAHKETK